MLISEICAKLKAHAKNHIYDKYAVIRDDGYCSIVSSNDLGYSQPIESFMVEEENMTDELEKYLNENKLSNRECDKLIEIIERYRSINKFKVGDIVIADEKENQYIWVVKSVGFTGVELLRIARIENGQIIPDKDTRPIAVRGDDLILLYRLGEKNE